MESKEFDAVVQRVFGGQSRRGLVRTGLGAFAAAALGLLGISEARETEAARKPRKPRGPRRRKKRVVVVPAAPAPAPKFANQTPCTSNSQCLSGTCSFNGRGQVCCSQDGARCGTDFDCCGQLVCNGGFCA